MSKYGLARIAIIADQDNASYAKPMAEAFSLTFTSLGGAVASEVWFAGGSSPDFVPLVDTLQASQPDSVFIIASPVNAGILAQAIRLRNWAVPLFAAPWAQGEGLIQNGGKAVEGLETIIGFDTNASSPALLKFKENYQKRFAGQPVFSAMEGYETSRMLIEALKKTNGSAQGLAEALLGLQDFQGLTGPVRLDEYGDAVRPLYLQRVVAGKFQTVDTVAPVP
jgi:branched-chain amino acid transport system substrate-binding protein